MNRENGMDDSGEPEEPRITGTRRPGRRNKKEGVETTVNYKKGKHRAIPFVSPIRSPPEAGKGN
jgi:hypothetical protein